MLGRLIVAPGSGANSSDGPTNGRVVLNAKEAPAGPAGLTID